MDLNISSKPSGNAFTPMAGMCRTCLNSKQGKHSVPLDHQVRISRTFCRLSLTSFLERPKGKSSNSAPSTSSPGEGPSNSKPDTKTSGKRRHDSPEIIEIPDWSPKQPRGRGPQQPSNLLEAQNAKAIDKSEKALKTTNEKVSPITASHKKRRTRSPSIEIIPDSDEEANLSIQFSPQSLPVNSSLRRQSPQRNGNRLSITSQPDANPLSEEQPSSNVSLHQVRKGNPLVKMVDFDPGTMSGAISTKAYAVDRSYGGSSSNKPSKRTRPGPGRSSANLIKSSLLTADKGTLKTVKGKYQKSEKAETALAPIDQMETGTEDNNIVPQAPPSAEELLELAGLDAQAAESLPDFEEIEEIQKSPSPVLDPAEQGTLSKEDRPFHARRSVAVLLLC